MSLMSFMGMTLNPMESSMTGDTGTSGSESDAGTISGTGTTENVDMQSGDTGAGGFDFDAGGFDSF